MKKCYLEVIVEKSPKINIYKIPGTPFNKNNIYLKKFGETWFNQVITHDNEIYFINDGIYLNLNYEQINEFSKKIKNIFENLKFKVKEIRISLLEEFNFEKIKREIARIEDEKDKHILNGGKNDSSPCKTRIF
ncbi:MAG: hypothetical protein QXL51_00075 [Candidatus Aenigmatarchaeota archaeon]